MKVKMSIRNKMLVNILTTSVIIFALTIGYMSYKSRVLLLEDAKKIALSVTKENALKIEQQLTNDMEMLKTLSDVYAFNASFEENLWKSYYADVAKQIFNRKDYLLGFSASWEESFYKEETGQKQRYYYHLGRESGSVKEEVRIKDLASNVYQKSKKLNKTVLLEPRKYTKDGVELNKVYLSSPIRVRNAFAGYVVADFSSESFQKIIEKITPYKSTVGYLFSNDGVFVSHPDKSLIGDSLINVLPHYQVQFTLTDVVKKGSAEVFKGLDSLGNRMLLATVPIQVGEHKAPWALALEIPIKSILVEANKTQTNSLIAAIFGILLIAGIIYWRASNIGSAIKTTTEVLEKLSMGDVENIKTIALNRGDEIDVMVASVNSLKTSLNTTSDFAEQIGIGRLDAQFTPLGENDKLGNSLLNMQQNLKKAKKEEERMKQEEDRNRWTSDGLAQFGEIIRTNNENIDKLSYSIVKSLVDYLALNQGALFVSEQENDETVYVIKAAVAYERRKIINAKYKKGESLVGRCVFEKKAIYMTDLPQDYINITSGLGTLNPSSLLLVPLIAEDKVLGVIELASMHEIDQYKIAFVEKLAESIASTLASAQINQQTVQLLEQSKVQSEELAAQEEEMRQNMEELQATQEEAARREREMSKMLDAFEQTFFKTEYDLNGKIVGINEMYLSFLRKDQESLLGISFSKEMELLNSSTNAGELWSKIKNATIKEFESDITIDSENYKLVEHYSLLNYNDSTIPDKIVKISYCNR